MQKITVLLVMIAMMVIIGSVSAVIPTVTVPTAGGISGGANQVNVNLYRPCLTCGTPIVGPTPTPSPTAYIDFSVSASKIRYGQTVTLAATQTGGPTMVNPAWYWQISNTPAQRGQVVTIKPTRLQSYNVMVTVVDPVTQAGGSIKKSSVFTVGR